MKYVRESHGLKIRAIGYLAVAGGIASAVSQAAVYRDD